MSVFSLNSILTSQANNVQTGEFMKRLFSVSEKANIMAKLFQVIPHITDEIQTPIYFVK